MDGVPTPERILQAAHHLFTHKGFANTSVREICEGAEVTAPVIYYHFGSKDGVFQAVVEDALNLDGFCDRLREAVAACPDPWAKLRAFVHTYLSTFPLLTLNPGLHLGNSAQLNDASLRRFGLGLESAYQLARQILQAGISSGAFRPVKVDTAAACLLGTVDSFVRSRAYLGVEYDLEEVADCVVNLFSGGLSAKQA
ncbi:MAG: TetR/AcrR family transcriptional regulator [Anaerolineae bacterium]|nr:TetR/AcrR family transcriptional regulator [Anaerolineae bacterium]